MELVDWSVDGLVDDDEEEDGCSGMRAWMVSS
jgi:hypothetical protein